MRGFSHVDLMLLYIVVVWGSVFTVINVIVSEGLPINAVNALRFLLLVPSFVVILALRRDYRLSAKDAVMVTVLGIIGFSAYQLLSSYGISRSVVAGAALIIAATPIFASLFSGVLRVEKVDLTGWLGITVGFVGISVLVIGEHGLQVLSMESIEGELALVAGAACWALGAVISKPLMNRHSSIKITAYSSAIGCALFLPFIWSDLLEADWAAAGPVPILLVLYWVFAGNVVGQLVRFYSVKRIGPHRATAYIYLVPFSAALIAAMFLGSPVEIHHLLGGTVIFSGIALTRVSRRAPVIKPPPAAP